METPQTSNPPAEPEAEPTRRALDPFFEAETPRDHANQWHVAEIWPGDSAAPKPTPVESR